MLEGAAQPQVSRRALLKGALAGGALLSLSGLLEACGASAPKTSLGTGASANIGTDTGKPIDMLNVLLPGSLSNLYPGQEAGILNYYVAATTIEGLVNVDSAGKIVPGVASKISRPNDKTYVYTLRDGVKFSDGTPLTADDVLYSLEMARDSKTSPSIASYWANLASARQTGDKEITLVTKAVDQAFEWLPSGADSLWIMPKKFWQANHGKVGTSSAMLIGTGAYKVTSFVPDSYVELTRADDWWGGSSKVKAIRFNFIGDDDTRLLAWNNGKAQMALNVPLAQAAQWSKPGKSRVVYEPDRSYVGLTFNVTAKPFDDPHVRKAIAYAINRESLVADILHGKAQVATAMSTPQQFGGLWTPDEATNKLAAVPQYEFSISKAKAELAKSSVPHGFTAGLSYPNTGSQLGTAALAFANTLKQIGITINVKELAIEQWLAELGKYPPLGYMWYFNTTGDPAELASYLLGPGNPAKYSNKSVSALMSRVATESDPEKRANLLIRAQKAQAADLAYLPLWWGQSATAFADSIGVQDFTSYTLLTSWPSSVYAAK